MDKELSWDILARRIAELERGNRKLEEENNLLKQELEHEDKIMTFRNLVSEG